MAVRKYSNVIIDTARDSLLTDYARTTLKDFYLHDNEISPQMGYARAANAWCGGDLELAQRIYDYVSAKFMMFASPVLSNAPNGKKHKWGLPISCFLTYVPDTVDGLISHSSELRYLSVMGGGVGGHWSDVRSVSDIAPGPIPFLHTVDADMQAYKQGRTRKGSYAAYLDIDHPDIIEFMQLRIPTGDVQRKALNLHNAINITDDFMQAVLEDKDWNLIDPNSKKVRDTIKARKLWQRILETRFRTGEPYINFIDTANKFLPQALKDKGLKIHGSNLCNEIHLPTNEDRTAVCCLSSLNLEYYDEWKDTTIVEDLITMLDNVLEYFIDNAPDRIARARRSAYNERSLGLGAMGFHSLLHRRGLAWESKEAQALNHRVFSTMHLRAQTQTTVLAKERGEYPDGIGTGKRNSHLLAIAPNASSGIILSTSPSVEPLKANAYTHRTRIGSFLVKNKYLEQLLETKNKNDEETWNSIITNKGSVQDLNFLSDHEKAIYKTSFELDQNWIIQHAADRQQYICQGQSINLFFYPGAEKSYVNKVHLDAWRKGLKGLYYLRTEASVRAETVNNKVGLDKLQDANVTVIYGKDNCSFCQKAKEILNLNSVTYEYIDLDKEGKTAAEVCGREDWKSVPIVYINGKFIGGYKELVDFFNNDNIITNNNQESSCRACEG